MGVLPVDKAREAATRAYDELQIPVGSPPEHVVATFRTLCLQRAFHINDPGTNSTNNNGERNNVSQAGGDAFQREAVAYRFLRSLPLLTDTDYKPGAILARLRPLEEPRFRDIPSTERASAMLDVCITTMEQAQRTWQLPYTNYVLTVHYCLRKHIVRRRYSEFASLHAVLQRKLPVLPALPERSWLLKLQLPSERAQHLTQYILRVTAMLANRGLFSLEMMTFLDIDFTHIRAEEEALAIEYLARASDSGGGSGSHLFYILSASWLESWKRFVASGRDPPAKIENGHLLATREEDEQDKEGGGHPSSTTQPQSPRQGLVLGHSYRCINFVSWQYLSLVYGGGPVLIRKTASIYGRIAVDMPTLATTMQKLVRGFLGRQQAATRRLYVLRQDPTFEKRLGTIERQRLVEERMAMVRNYVSAREYQIRHIAIIKIQRAFRKHLLRHEHALLMAESAVPNAAETFQHVEEYFSLEEIGLIRDAKYRLAHFLVTMNKGVPIQKLRSRRKVPQWRLFRIDAIGSQLLWSSKKKAHALAFIDITTLVVESPLLLKTGFGRRRSTTYDHAVVLSYEYEGGDKKELILICESQCDCDALYFGLHALMTETRARTANGATYVDGHGLIRKKYPHAKRLISDAQQLIDQQVRSPFRMNQSHADRNDDGDGSRTRPQYEPHRRDDRESHQRPRDLSLMAKLTSSKHATWSVELVSKVDQSDERVRRRREQFKAYQRRRRVNYRLRLERLEHDVHALAAETSALQAQSLYLFCSRGTDAGAPANLVAEFYRVYAHGHCAAQSTTQSQFVKAMMAQDVQGPEFSGVEALIEQFQLYGTLFASATYHPERTTVRTIAETTLVIVDIVMTLRLNRRGVQCLLPHVADDEVAVQCLVSQPMVALGAVHFLFNAAGKVTWHGAEIDFVGALNGLTGSIQTTADWLAHANFSLSTGRITSAPSNHHDDNDPMPVAMPPSERHAIAYLLS